jgi:prepilin peptidase CpaA
MPLPIDAVRWIVVLLTGVTLAVAGVSDMRHRRIPNSAVFVTVTLFIAWYLISPSVSLFSSLVAAFAVFLCGFTLYSFKIIGAGDSKLATAVALFAGLHGLPQFVVYMALAGGVLALCMLAAQPANVMVMLHTRGRGHSYRGVPYGVAIAIAGVMILLVAMRPQFLAENGLSWVAR